MTAHSGASLTARAHTVMLWLPIGAKQHDNGSEIVVYMHAAESSSLNQTRQIFFASNGPRTTADNSRVFDHSILALACAGATYVDHAGARCPK